MEKTNIRTIEVGEIIIIEGREYLVNKAGVGGHPDKYKISLALVEKLFQGSNRRKRSNKIQGIKPAPRKNQLQEIVKNNNLKLIKLSNINIRRKKNGN